MFYITFLSTHQQYLEHFNHSGPLSPSRFGNQVVTVATMTPVSVPDIAIIIMNLCYLIMCAT